MKKSKLTWLWITLAVVLVLGGTLAGLILGGVIGGKEPETVAEAPKLYWNVNRANYVAKGVQGTSSRIPSSDGYYYIRMAVEGGQVDVKVADMAIVNRIEFQEVMGLEFDENNIVVDVLTVDQFTGGMASDKWPVVSMETGKLIVNTAANYKGLQRELVVGDYTRYWEIGDFEALVGIKTVPVEGDQVTAIMDKDGRITDVFVFPFVEPGDVYWNVNRQYDSTLGVTKREPDMTGCYVYEFAVNGEIKTLKTRDKAIADYIDKHSSQNMGLVFDEDGYIIEVTNAGNVVCGGGLVGTGFFVDAVDGDQLSYSKAGSKYTDTLSKDCKYFDVSGQGAFIGVKADGVKVGDTIMILKDRRDQVCLIYITGRLTNNPIYWVSERNEVWDRTNWVTKRKPDGNGWYHIKLSGEGGEITAKTKDAALVNEIDSYVCYCFDIDEDGVIQGITAATNHYGGSTFGLFAKVDAYEDGVVTVTNTSNKQEVGTLAEDAKIYLIADNATRKGVVTDIEVGDTIYGLKDRNGKIAHVFIYSRPYDGKIYWNVTRLYSDTTKQTSRIPDAKGRYWFETVVDGQTKWLYTTDKKIATNYDVVVSRARGLRVEGNKILEVLAPAALKNYKEIEPYAGWSVVTAVNGRTISSTSSDGKTTNKFTLASGCKIYNVGGGYVDYRGEKTTIEVGDQVVAMVNKSKSAVIVYVCGDRRTPQLSTVKSTCDCGANVVWTPWDGTGPTKIDPGHYYLTRDIVVPDGGYEINTRTVHIRLDGHTISGEGRLFAVKASGQLNICDHGENVGSLIGNAAASDSGGLISTASSYSRVNIYNITMKMETTSASTIANGGVISAAGVVSLYDVDVYGGTVTRKGGAIAVMPTGNFRMYGGSVTGGTAGIEGGNLVSTGNSYIEGVTFVGGSAPEGAGIAITAKDKNVTLKDCTVVSEGGGIYVVSGDVTLAGNMQVTENKNYNLKLSTGSSLKVDGLGGDTRIGITVAAAGVFATGADGILVDSFKPEGDEQKILYDEVEMTLAIGAEHQHCLCVDGTMEHTCTEDGFYKLTADMFTNATTTSTPIKKSGANFVIASGNYYLAEDINLTGQILLSSEAVTVKLCLNGHTMTAPATSRVFAINGGDLTITDCGNGSLVGGKVGSAPLILVQVGGKLHVYGGTFVGGTATYTDVGYGAALSVTKGTADIYGGTFVGGSAGVFGGTIYIADGQTLNIAGGTFENGTAKTGDGIYVGKGAKVSISGEPVIEELYLPTGTTITQNVTGNASVGIYMDQMGVFAEGTEMQVENFVCKNEGFAVKHNNGELSLAWDGPVEDAGSLTMKYDDRIALTELGGADAKSATIFNETVTSKKAGSNDPDAHVLMAADGYLVAAGTGSATVIVEGKQYTVTVEKAAVSLFMITGHSIGAGQGGDGGQSVAVEPGQSYYFRGTLSADGMGLGYGAEQRPAGIDSYSAGQAGAKGIGSALAYEWNQLTGEKVWVINNAVGGSCINEWQPGAVVNREGRDDLKDLYGKAVRNYQAAQQIIAKEVAAGHYTLSEMAIINFTAANYQANLGNYMDYTMDSLKKDFETLWNSFKSDLTYDVDGDGNTETVSAIGYIPLYVESTDYGTDQPATYFMSASEEYPDMFTASVYKKYTTAEGLAQFPDITYTAQNGTALQKPVSVLHSTQGGTSTNSFFCSEDFVHLSQVAYNMVGMEAADSLYKHITGDTKITSLEVVGTGDQSIGDSVTIHKGEELVLVPLAQPFYGNGLTFAAQGAVEITYPFRLVGKEVGTGTVTISDGDTVLKTISVTVTEAHSHCLCADTLDHTHTETDMGLLTQADFDNATADSLRVSKDGANYKIVGNYALAEDITISSQILVFGKTNLCLNGHSLVSTGNRVFAVSGGELTITDCGTTGKVKGATAGLGATILLQGSGGSASGNPPKLTVYGGTIEGGKTTSTATGQGGNIDIFMGTADIYGGKFVGGEAKTQGGNIIARADATLNIYGGEFTSGTAAAGPCLYVVSGAKVTLDGEFTIEHIYLSGGKLNLVSLPEGFTTGLTSATEEVFATGIENAAWANCFISTGNKVVYDEENKTLGFGQQHLHCLCVGNQTHTCTNVLWQPITQADFTNATTSTSPVKKNGSNYNIDAGNYYLEENISISGQIVLTNAVSLCLNNKTISAPSNNRFMAINGGTFNVTDCGTKGTIVSGKASTGAGFYIQLSGKMNVYGGTIQGGQATNGAGGAIYLNAGTFTMYGGTVQGGRASTVGGAIIVNSNQTAEFYGGTVTKGTAGEGRGYGIYVAATGKVTVGGTAVIEELHLQGSKFTISADKPLQMPALIGVTSSLVTPEIVISESVTTDPSPFLNCVKAGYTESYDATAKTLKLVTAPTFQNKTMAYDDRWSVSGTVSIYDQRATSFAVGTTEYDENVLIYENGTIIAVGVGTATVKVDDTYYKVTVKAADISMFMITGHSVGEGVAGDATQSVVSAAGQVYSSHGVLSLPWDNVTYGLGYGAKNRAENPAYSTSTLDAFAAGGGGTVGEGSGLAYRWNQLTGEKVWVINTARGGSCINQWQPGTNYYDAARNVFQRAQKAMKNEIAAGHYNLKNMAIIYHGGANFDQYPGYTQAGLEKDYKAMWNGFKAELATDMNGDGKTETIQALGLVPIWTASGNLNYSTDKTTSYYFAASSQYPDVFMASLEGRKWLTDADVAANFPAVNYTIQTGTLTKPTSVLHTNQGGSSANSVFCSGDKVHYAQVAYNAQGFVVAENLYKFLRGTSSLTSFKLLTTTNEVIGDTLTLKSGGLQQFVPVVDPITVSDLTFTVSGNLTVGPDWMLIAGAPGTGTLTVSYNGQVLKTITVTITE